MTTAAVNNAKNNKAAGLGGEGANNNKQGKKKKCKHGIKCYKKNCKFWHPEGWDPSPQNQNLSPNNNNDNKNQQQGVNDIRQVGQPSDENINPDGSNSINSRSTESTNANTTRTTGVMNGNTNITNNDANGSSSASRERNSNSSRKKFQQLRFNQLERENEALQTDLKELRELMDEMIQEHEEEKMMLQGGGHSNNQATTNDREEIREELMQDVLREHQEEKIRIQQEMERKYQEELTKMREALQLRYQEDLKQVQQGHQWELQEQNAKSEAKISRLMDQVQQVQTNEEQLKKQFQKWQSKHDRLWKERNELEAKYNDEIRLRRELEKQAKEASSLTSRPTDAIVDDNLPRREMVNQEGSPWFCSDPSGCNVQGPFEGGQLQKWLQEGNIRPADLCVSQNIGGPFLPFSLVFPDTQVAFEQQQQQQQQPSHQPAADRAHQGGSSPPQLQQATSLIPSSVFAPKLSRAGTRTTPTTSQVSTKTKPTRRAVVAELPGSGAGTSGSGAGSSQGNNKAGPVQAKTPAAAAAKTNHLKPKRPLVAELPGTRRDGGENFTSCSTSTGTVSNQPPNQPPKKPKAAAVSKLPGDASSSDSVTASSAASTTTGSTKQSQPKAKEAVATQHLGRSRPDPPVSTESIPLKATEAEPTSNRPRPAGSSRPKSVELVASSTNGIEHIVGKPTKKAAIEKRLNTNEGRPGPSSVTSDSNKSNMGGGPATNLLDDGGNDERLMDYLFPKTIKDKRPNPSAISLAEVDEMIQSSGWISTGDFIAKKFFGMNHGRAKKIVSDINGSLERKRKDAEQKRSDLQVNFNPKSTKGERDEIVERFNRKRSELDEVIGRCQRQVIDADELVRTLSNEKIELVVRELNKIPDTFVSPIFDMIKGDENEASRGRQRLALEVGIKGARTKLRREMRHLEERKSKIGNSIKQEQDIADKAEKELKKEKEKKIALQSEAKDIEMYLGTTGLSSEMKEKAVKGEGLDKSAVRAKYQQRLSLLKQKEDCLVKKQQLGNHKEKAEGEIRKLPSAQSLMREIEELRGARDAAESELDKEEIAREVKKLQEEFQQEQEKITIEVAEAKESLTIFKKDLKLERKRLEKLESDQDKLKVERIEVEEERDVLQKEVKKMSSWFSNLLGSLPSVSFFGGSKDKTDSTEQDTAELDQEANDKHTQEIKIANYKRRQELQVLRRTLDKEGAEKLEKEELEWLKAEDEKEIEQKTKTIQELSKQIDLKAKDIKEAKSCVEAAEKKVTENENLIKQSSERRRISKQSLDESVTKAKRGGERGGKFMEADDNLKKKEEELKTTTQTRKNKRNHLSKIIGNIKTNDREAEQLEERIQELSSVLPWKMTWLLGVIKKEIDELGLLIAQKTQSLQETRDKVDLLQRSLEDPKLDEPIEIAKNLLEDLRSQCRKFLGVDRKEPEDAGFDINGSRDERGHSFLLVAVFCGDVKTVKTCLQFGADPSEICSDRLTPLSVASYFNLSRIGAIFAQIVEVPAFDPTKTVGDELTTISSGKRMDWNVVLAIADRAAETPDETEDASRAARLEANEESRMPLVTSSEREGRELSFFDSTLTGEEVDKRNIRRQVLMEKSVYDWFCEANETKTIFLEFLASLLPREHRQRTVSRSFLCHRRSEIGLTGEMQYEVLAVELNDRYTVLFSPFVTSSVEGYASMGVLVWAVGPESFASLLNSKIETTEFLRNKWDSDDHFPGHSPFTLELGKDMHLLDLRSTNIYTSRPAVLLVIDVDEGELEQLEDPSFAPRHRVLDYEQKIARALFQQTEAQAKDEKEILSKAKGGKSILLTGGAGTGKTKLLMEKVIREPANLSCLVVTRLSRLLSLVKSNVENARDTHLVQFMTYEDLMAKLAFRVSAPAGKERCFAIVSQVQFGTTKSSGEASATTANFVQNFVGTFLGDKERKAMKMQHVEALTLFSHIRIIKSNARCLENLSPLSREAYMQLPNAFGLDSFQRNLVYDLFERYQEWLGKEVAWDEADRTLYILKYGPSVFRDEFVSWRKRYRQGLDVEKLMEEGVVDDDGRPLAPFAYHKVMADEAQDFSELDLTLFVRMSSSVKGVFLAADTAQSVEVGLSMRASTVNEVMHASTHHREGIQVKDVIDNVQMRMNHRTHEQNLGLSQSIRKILARSFQVPWTDEHALIKGKLPQVLSIEKLEDLADESIFRAASIAFICPDEAVDRVRSLFLRSKITCDVFGVREAKGLEFDSVALLDFFAFFEARKDLSEAWRNSLRWLFSKKESMATTESAEEVLGKVLEPCDYLLSHPELQDQAAMLYTALTRSRNRLYLIETKTRGGLGDFAFRCFAASGPNSKRGTENLGLAEKVDRIDEGTKEMTPQQHKQRGVELVCLAFNMRRDNEPFAAVLAQLEDARSRFAPEKGNDDQLWKLCTRHIEVMDEMRKLRFTADSKFFNKERGVWDLKGRFPDLLQFEENLIRFFRKCDSFVLEEAQDIASLVRQMSRGTHYEVRFESICAAIQNRLGF